MAGIWSLHDRNLSFTLQGSQDCIRLDTETSDGIFIFWKALHHRHPCEAAAMPPASLSHADLPIRRGCVIVALMALGAMAALAHEPVLALRLGAEVAAFLTLGLVQG